jgi:hypothetical protein
MRFLLIVYFIVIFCSCSSKRSVNSDNSNQVLVIDLLSVPVSKVTRLSEFAENIEYIPLQTTENSLVGPFILKVVNPDNRIYIRNSGLGGEILCFDMDGNFLSKLENSGRGPKQYASITDFDVSSDNKILAILSSINHKIVVFGISNTDFAFRKSISLKDPAPYKLSFVPESNNVFLAIPPWSGSEPTLSILINNSDDTIYFKPNCYQYNIGRKANYMASSEMVVYTIANKVCFKEEFSDTVFYADAKDNFFKPRIIFDSHGTLITPAMRGGSETPRKDVTRIDYIFETSRYVFYWYRSSESLNGFIFDRKKREKFNLFNVYDNSDFKSEMFKNGIKDDLSGGPDFNIEFAHNYFSGGKIFSLVEAMKLKKYVAGEDFNDAKGIDPNKKEKLKKLADSLKETDNPVLVIVTPKE